MTKKTMFGCVGMIAVMTLAGCGKDTDTSKYLLDEDYSQYVSVCEYKGVETSKIVFDVTDEEIQEQIDQLLYEYVSYEEITGRGVELGDMVNLDYTASLDEETDTASDSDRDKEAIEEEYSGTDEEIVVGEGVLYPEVEDALIGMKAGDSKTVEVVLTEDYAEEEDVGQKLSVEVKLNTIDEEILPEYNDDFVKENTDYDSMEAYETSVKEELMQDKEEEYKAASQEEIFDYLVEHSEFNGYPDALYTQCEEEYDNNNAFYAAMWQMDLEDYLELLGITDADREEGIQSMIKQELVVGAIAQKEGITCNDKEVRQFAEDIYEEYDYDSVEDFLQDYSDREIGQEIIYQKVATLLYDNATYKEKTEEEYLAEQEAEYEDESDDSSLDEE
ncbi:MAG: FKBP-type peptidyl-prolyl cis-trans isomerase [Lachnospiraceae bacterium]|nr:FKBP-type peptidyl-prolyl cis-trans isomerase [Lachnospiraceae bacterium]